MLCGKEIIMLNAIDLVHEHLASHHGVLTNQFTACLEKKNPFSSKLTYPKQFIFILYLLGLSSFIMNRLLENSATYTYVICLIVFNKCTC